MPTTLAFAEWLDRLHTRDADVVAEFVRHYQPHLLHAVRLHMGRARLSAVLDEEDIVQTVLCSFFAKESVRQYALDNPDQLRAVLVTMAHNCARDEVSRHLAARRDSRRVAGGGGSVLESVMDAGPTPSQLVADREFMSHILSRMSPDERELFGHRAAGRRWESIARTQGIKPESLRKKLQRAFERVSHQLGLRPSH